MNTKDPLLKTGPEAQKELFEKFSQQANGYTTDDAVSAAVNVIVNALRQKHSTWKQAELTFDDLFGRSKSILANHYDSTGRKKGIFPYDQVISVPFLDLRPKKL